MDKLNCDVSRIYNSKRISLKNFVRWKSQKKIDEFKF